MPGAAVMELRFTTNIREAPREEGAAISPLFITTIQEARFQGAAAIVRFTISIAMPVMRKSYAWRNMSVV